MGVAVFMGVFALAFLAFALVDPRKVWWRFQARRFENPEAHEPSAAVYLLLRVMLLGMGIVMAWQSVEPSGWPRPPRVRITTRLSSAWNRRRRIWSRAGRDGSSPAGRARGGEYFKDELTRPGEDVVAILVFKSGNTERYEMDGVCLTVIAQVLPGEPEPRYAHIDDRRYSLKADVTDSPCT